MVADGRMGIVKGYVIALYNLCAQVVAALVGGIEAELQGILGQIVDQRAAIGTKACAVANNALGIETDMKGRVTHDNTIAF